MGSLGCAHSISIHLKSMYLRNCERIWNLLKKPEDPPLTPVEVLSTMPPCIMGVQKIPCRTTFLASRSSRSKKRRGNNRSLIVEAIEVEGETDESDDSESDSTSKSGRDIVIPLEQLILDRTLKMMNLERSALERGAEIDRPRCLTSSHDEVDEMKDDVKKYISEFPRNQTKLYEQDYIHELEYREMYRGKIPKNNNWGFYLYRTAVA